ncbi:MAG: aminopeptidase, partial [Stenotrophomonas sp.]
MSRKLLLCLAATAALTACKGETAAPAPAPVADTTPAAAGHAFSPEINVGDFGELVKTLASDEFEGRAPGSTGEDRTVEYIRDQMQRIGLQPGNGDSWFQEVAMTETTADESTVLKLDQAGKTRELKFGTDMVIGTRSGQKEVKIDGSDLV